MTYLKGAQPVPGKGLAWMYYEVDDNGRVQRTLTHLPETGEITRVPDPIVRKVYRPEMLEVAAEADFISLWGDA